MWLSLCGYNTYASTFVERPLQITLYFTKQSQLYAFLGQKRRFRRKTKPIQSQTNPKQTQFLSRRSLGEDGLAQN